MAKNYLEEKAKKILEEEYRYHEENQFLWFTQEVGEEYRRKALALGQDISDVGARKQLRVELQTKYGLREIEALNVINGYHITEYAKKYKRIKDKIPTEIIRRPKEEDDEEDDRNPRDDW